MLRVEHELSRIKVFKRFGSLMVHHHESSVLREDKVGDTDYRGQAAAKVHEKGVFENLFLASALLASRPDYEPVQGWVASPF